MNLCKARELFPGSSISFLLIDENGEAVSSSPVNLSGGACNCCSPYSGYAEDFTVVRVANIESMSVLWDSSMSEPADPPKPEIYFPPVRSRPTNIQSSSDPERIQNPPSSAVFFDDE